MATAAAAVKKIKHEVGYKHGSRTITATKKKTPTATFKQQGSHSYYLKRKIIHPISKANRILSKGAARNLNAQYSQDIIQISPGEQSTSDHVMCVGSLFDIVNHTRYTGGGATRDVFLKYVKARIMGTSLGLGNVILKIYEVVAKTDTTENYDTPYEHWATGNVNESGTAAYKFPGSAPNQSKLFNQFWKVDCVYTKPLSQGESFVIDFYWELNKRLSGQKIDQMNDSAPTAHYGSYKGVTRHFMCVAHGLPYNSVTNPDTDTNVSTGQGKIDLIMTKWYCSQTFEAAANSTTYSSGLPITFTGGQQIMLPEDDDVETYTEA